MLTGWQDGTSIWLSWAPLLSVASSGRYLEDQAGTPFLILSDSPQGMLTELTTAQMATYFSTRHDQGFNFTQVHVISGPTFGGGANGETYDSIAPFTSTGDIATPNSTYFARLDTLLTTAAQYGIVVMLNAAEMIDHHDLWKNNGNTKCYNFGAYLGNRYKDYPNVVWCVGNDWTDYNTDTDTRTAIINIMDGIKSADANHIHTAWLYYPQGSRETALIDAEVSLSFGYSYFVPYDLMEIERARTPAKPVFFGEGNYFTESLQGYTTTAFVIRKQNYWSMLAGGCGTTVMNNYWQFSAGWDTSMSDTCFLEVAYLKALLEAYDWHLLTPDSTNTILTVGLGTKGTGWAETSINTNDYAPCSYIGTLSGGVTVAMIYMPTNRTMTVDMSEFGGSVTCRWFDPTNGTYTADAASPHANSGTHDFSRATANSAGGSDWVLVMET